MRPINLIKVYYVSKENIMAADKKLNNTPKDKRLLEILQNNKRIQKDCIEEMIRVGLKH